MYNSGNKSSIISRNEIYDSLSDEELIVRLREGDRHVTDYLMEKYKGMVRSKAKSMFILGADNDDLIQEGMIGLFNAVQDYDFGRDASFSTFADLCIARKMYTAIQSAGRKKNVALNQYISIYSDDEGAENTIAVPVPEEIYNPEMHVIDKESVSILESRIEDALSPFEKQVLELHLTGLGYVEISKILSKDSKSTDNALSRIKTKVKKIIEEIHSSDS